MRRSYSMRPLARRPHRRPAYVTAPGGVEELEGGRPDSRGACATCGHDEDEHDPGVERVGCCHRARITQPDPFLPGRVINLRGELDCLCREFVPIQATGDPAA